MPSQPWILRPQVEPSAALRAAVGGHPLVARLLAQRGMTTAEKALPFLDSAAYVPARPSALVGLNRAAKILMDAVRQGRNFLVWGDFDVDGQTSTTLLVAALRELAGAERVRFHVPNRFSEGHGIQPAKLKALLEDASFEPQVLLTCDTGIGDGEGIGMAKGAGLTVVVTDHHDLPAEFADAEAGKEPPCGEPADVAGEQSVRRADAIVNPKFLHVDDPLRTLPGVGVAYKLVQRLYELAGDAEGAAQFLDLVALGIVADVAEQMHDTRYLLQTGLDRLRRTERIGLKALMEIARLSPDSIDAQAIGFQIGPRMNALGRLDDATVAVELLTTDDAIRAGQLAAQMERLNNERRLLTSQITQTAFDMLEREPVLLDFNAIVLANPNWHAGIIGIVAARLVEAYHKPTVLLCSAPGEPARGSARSTAGVDIGWAIAGCAELLMHHGGHPGAAGVTLEAANIDRFRRELSRQVDQNRIDAGPEGLQIDAELPFSEVSLTLAEEIERLAPFGNGNPLPKFVSQSLRVVQDRRIGRDGAHRRLLLQDKEERRQTAVWWRSADVELPGGEVDIAYTLGVNEYRGERTAQLTLEAVRAAEEAEATRVVEGVEGECVLHDLRRELVSASNLPSFDCAVWYAEGTRLGEIPLHSRLASTRAETGRPLVLWSSPPSPELLHWLVERVAPSELYLIGRDTAEAQPDAVLKQVAGMAKWSMRPGEDEGPGAGVQDGKLPIDRLAARIGLTEEIVRCSLLWLEQKGLVQLRGWEEGDVALVTPGDGSEGDGSERRLLQEELKELLAEVRAYRRFFQRAPVGALGLDGELQ
ncbi:MAG: single-stranded-DNA-specific exonuclease RecJ [Caldilineaceae bacterium SB0668_bin_21]|nr:single-stranded-DNA-specific exonuclease RecJ [Caldilineaceae bacterium SB0668_bin_21]MYC21872.1 single-stranded-DNA-specific exonuclease RecJ [Caldilineaceae bacterium SB0662_bin_25]